MALSLCKTETDAQGRELTAHGTAAFPAAGYYDDLAAEAVPWHWHNEIEVLVVAEGQAVVAAGTKKFTAGAGDGIFINAGVLHAAWNAGAGPCRIHSMVFHPRLVGGSVDSVFWQEYLHPLTADPSLEGTLLGREIPWHREASEMIERAWQACEAGGPGHPFRIREALSWLVYLLASHQPAARKPLPEKALRNDARIKQMLQYIQQHYAEELTVTEIARSATISVSECLRCFHSTIGVPPIQYLKQIRLQKAAALLSATPQKVADIGLQCGFQEMSYFAKAFKEAFGCTPSEYRKRGAGKAKGCGENKRDFPKKF